MPFNSNIYNLNFSTLVKWMLPIRLRRVVALAYLNAFVTPITTLHNALLRFKENIVYRLLISPQVCYLEKALNDKYDTLNRRIYIVDAIEYNALPLYLKLENKRVVLPLKADGHLVLYTKAETSIFTVDFVVMVPLGLAFSPIEFRAFLNTERLLTKTYSIQTY